MPFQLEAARLSLQLTSGHPDWYGFVYARLRSVVAALKVCSLQTWASLKEISFTHWDSPIADSDGPGFPNSDAVPGRDRGCKASSGYGITTPVLGTAARTAEDSMDWTRYLELIQMRVFSYHISSLLKISSVISTPSYWLKSIPPSGRGFCKQHRAQMDLFRELWAEISWEGGNDRVRKRSKVTDRDRKWGRETEWDPLAICPFHRCGHWVPEEAMWQAGLRPGLLIS